MSFFYFFFQCQKVLNLLCFFSTQIDHLNGLQTIIKPWKSESHSALWHNLAQFKSIFHPVHYWAQYGLVWHIIKAEYLNPITKTSPLVQFEKIQLNLPRFGTIVLHTSQICAAGLILMHKIEFCCPIWVDLAQYGTSIYHSGVSAWQNYKMHLENEMKIPNSLCILKFFKFGNISRNNYSVS